MHDEGHMRSKMKKTFLMTALIALSSTLASAQDKEQKPRPEGIPEGLVEIKPGMAIELPPVEALITYTANYYQDSELKEKYYGRWAAIEGTIIKIEDGPKDNPIFQLKLAGDSKRELWIASLVEIDETMVKVGSQLKVLGLFDKTKDEPEYIAKLSENKDYLLGFCFYDTESGRPMYEKRLMRYCLDWENGKRLPKLHP